MTWGGRLRYRCFLLWCRWRRILGFRLQRIGWRWCRRRWARIAQRWGVALAGVGWIPPEVVRGMCRMAQAVAACNFEMSEIASAMRRLRVAEAKAHADAPGELACEISRETIYSAEDVQAAIGAFEHCARTRGQVISRDRMKSLVLAMATRAGSCGRDLVEMAWWTATLLYSPKPR